MDRVRLFSGVIPPSTTQINVGLIGIVITELFFSGTYRVLRKKPNEYSVIFENFGTGKFVSLCKKQ